MSDKESIDKYGSRFTLETSEHGLYWVCRDCAYTTKNGFNMAKKVRPGGFLRHLLKYHPKKLTKIKRIIYQYV